MSYSEIEAGDFLKAKIRNICFSVMLGKHSTTRYIPSPGIFETESPSSSTVLNSLGGRKLGHREQALERDIGILANFYYVLTSM